MTSYKVLKDGEFAKSPLDQVLEDRGSKYGSFDGHASITQCLKSVMSNTGNWSSHRLNTSQKEALEMIAHKIGRILNGDPNHADSWIDIAGYALLVVKELEK